MHIENLNVEDMSVDVKLTEQDELGILLGVNVSDDLINGKWRDRSLQRRIK